MCRCLVDLTTVRRFATGWAWQRKLRYGSEGGLLPKRGLFLAGAELEYLLPAAVPSGYRLTDETVSIDPVSWVAGTGVYRVIVLSDPGFSTILCKAVEITIKVITPAANPTRALIDETNAFEVIVDSWGTRILRCCDVLSDPTLAAIGGFQNCCVAEVLQCDKADFLIQKLYFPSPFATCQTFGFCSRVGPGLATVVAFSK